MMKDKECHMQCELHDHSCHQKCPKPLKKIHHKCEALKDIHTCHEKCGMDFVCHHGCPKLEKLWHMDHHKVDFLKDKLHGMSNVVELPEGDEDDDSHQRAWGG